MADWFEEYFGEEYLLLYPHRDEEDAERLVSLLCRTVGLMPGWRVLDVACGTGRHVAAFRARAAGATGLDLSQHLLQRAQGSARLPVVRSDLRRIPVRARTMDFTVNLFTSFGYFDSDAEHARRRSVQIRLLLTIGSNIVAPLLIKLQLSASKA